MKALYHPSVVVITFALAAGTIQGQTFYSGGFYGNNRTTLSIKSDGSCVLTNEALQPRKSTEMQVASWERYSKMSEGASTEDADPDAAAPPAQKSEKKPLTDEELGSKLREMYQQRSDFAEDAPPKIEAVEITTNTVRLVTTRAFASLNELVSQSPYAWGPALLMVQDARFEMDTNRNLRITLTGPKDESRYTKDLKRQLKSAKSKAEWKLVLPGKILSSSLPSTQDTATWFTLDDEKPDTIDAAIKLIGTPVVITAEAGGIKLDEPLETKLLARHGGRRKTEPDLPVTEAGPGFMAEPVSITLSTVHYFPEGRKYVNSRSEMMYGMNPTGAVVLVKMFPPKGRVIKSVSGLRVKAARDDKGRSIPAASEGDESEASYSESVSYNLSGTEETTGAQAQIRLALPEPDAKAIDELDGEAVALTIGGWKEMVLTNIQADAKKEIDLGEVLPGAKLIVKKITGERIQKSVQATLEGPKEVNQLDVRVKLSTPRSGQSNMSDRRGGTSGNKTTRNITIQAYEFESQEEAKGAPLTLLVRYPQDVKRERFQFKLTALDLL